jgi:methionine sulfoxide reductase heme-binding subunit
VLAFKPFVFLACLLPLVRLLVLGFTGGLGANPLEFVTRSTGTWTLVMLCLTLAVTPVRRFTSWQKIQSVRRMLGLYVFFYASLHLLTYVWFDHWFSPSDIARDVIKRPFVTIGFAAYLLLIPLALTSTKAMIRRLGKRWQQLHRLVYVIAVFALTHYWWLVKKDLTTPAIYAAVVGVLFLARPLGKRFSSWNRSRTTSRSRTT